MTDLHAIAETLATFVERWIASVSTDGSLAGSAAMDCRSAIERALATLQAQHEAERQAAVAEAIERCIAECNKHEVEMTTAEGQVMRVRTPKEIKAAICALFSDAGVPQHQHNEHCAVPCEIVATKPNAGDKVLVPREPPEE